MQPRKRKTMVTAATVAAALLLPLAGQGLAAFVDLAGGHWSASSAAALQARGLLSGFPDGSFRPEDLLTRAQMATLLVVALGRGADARNLDGVATRFSDMDGSHWAAGYVEELAELDVVKGGGDGRFYPEQPLTRAELAVLVARVARLPTDGSRGPIFLDGARIPDWAMGSVKAVADAGLMTGRAPLLFSPLEAVTRAEGATTLVRLLAHRGALYQVVGTLVSVQPASRTLLVRDAGGAERSLTLDALAMVFRAGLQADLSMLAPSDQVWAVLNSAGQVAFVEARFKAVLGESPKVAGNRLSYSTAGGTGSVVVQPGALVFLNGRPASLSSVDGAAQAYLALDGSTGEARVVDAVRYNLTGTIIRSAKQVIVVMPAGSPDAQQVPVAPGAVVVVGGQRTDAGALVPGQHISAWVDNNAVTYLQAE